MKRLFLLLGLSCGVITAGAQDIAGKAAELLNAYTTQGKFSGNVLIAKQGTIIFQQSYGYADRQHQIANTLQTTFRVGSLTKMFTSAVILKLAEAKKLSLQDPLSKFIAPFPGSDSIKIIHLLSHTSGIRGKGTAKPMPTLEEQVNLYQFDKVANLPGSAFEYNNFNYILLSYIAQKITIRPYEKLLANEVLAVAGMEHSGLDRNGRNDVRQAIGYQTNPVSGDWEAVTGKPVETASGAGAMYSSLSDLFKWSQLAGSGKIYSVATYELATKPVQGNYGLGWIINDHNGHKEVSHSGAIEGYVANFITYPEEGITIILLSNYGDTDGRRLSDDLRAIVFNEPYELPRQKVAITLPDDVLRRFAGTYELNEHFNVTVTLENNKLFALAKGDNMKIELIPESDHKFFLRGPQTTVEFLEESGKVSHLFVDMQGGMKLSRKQD